MKRLIFASLLAFLLNPLFAQQPYSRVRILAGQDELNQLSDLGLTLDHGIFKAGVSVTCELSSSEMAILEASGVPFELLIPDMERYYADRNEPYLSKLDELKRAAYTLSREWPVPEGFELGPVGGFLTLDQAMEHLDSMAARYPDLITVREPLDLLSHNSRQMFWVRLSDNPNVNEDEPEVLYTGMHHAREAIGMQLLIYYMYYLLEHYETDPEVQYIVNNFELYFIPVINVDGYAYNIQNSPNGGGMWRKNRRNNDDGSYGVDLNRNYGYMWGYNNSGSSPTPSDDTYRGPSAFSEPEIQNIRDFSEEHEFRIAINYHSYANMLLYPWGWTQEPCPDDVLFNFHSKLMTKENGYEYGSGSTTIYPTNGGSDDWMYGEQATRELIYSYTPEVGDGSAGFWPPVSQIIPLCQENMYQNIMAAKLCGPYAIVRDLSPVIMENNSGLLFFDIQRAGLLDGATYTVSITPLNDAIDSVSPPLQFTLDIMETGSGAFSYFLKEGIEQGEEVMFLLSVDDGFGMHSDTIVKMYGTPVVIFEDSASAFQNWISAKWNITTMQFHSPDHSIADSPTGQYTNYENNAMVLKDPVDLGEAVYASLSFWAKWNIEAGYDYVQVFASIDNGGSWTPLEGRYTRPGGANQPTGQPLYDGMQSNWVREEISLEPFLGNEIKIRFVLRSDSYVVADGFYWDDLAVTIIDLQTGMEDDRPAMSVPVVTVVPNPASDRVSLNYSEVSDTPGSVTLRVFDLNGRKVFETRGEGTRDVISWGVSHWPSGLYFFSLLKNQTVVASGRFLVE